MSYDKIWVERPVRSSIEPTAQEVALKETYLQAQKIAFKLLCSSNYLDHGNSPEVTSCARVVREALHKPEKERAAAVKSASEAVLRRQVKFVLAQTEFLEHQEDWLGIRATLVSHLEAVVTCETPGRYLLTELLLNCESVEDLIDYCDRIVAESLSKRCSPATQKLAEAAFDKAFVALVTTVGAEHWASSAGSSCLSFMATDPIFADLVLEGALLTVPASLPKCCALDDARTAFESAFESGIYNICRDFQQNTRGSLNEVQSSVTLLGAVPNLDAMLQADAERERKLRNYWRTRTSVRERVEQVQVTFGNVCKALPEAVAEAAAVESPDLRRRAQGLCMFAAHRLQANWSYIRDCDRWVDAHEDTAGDARQALERKHKALVERIKGKRLQQQPGGSCCYRRS